MTPDQFLARCRTIWHVAPLGSWDRLKEVGFQTAEQLIDAADLDDETRVRLLTRPRPEPVDMRIGDHTVTVRDQAPLLARRDLGSILGDGLEVADWMRLLNTRVYFFTEVGRRDKLLTKYVEQTGGQDLLVISPLRLLNAARGRLELSAQNAGAVARTSGVQKTRDTFVPLARFPDKRPAEVTVVDGLTDMSVVVRAERHHRDGRVESLVR